jgi:hypothetical protein
LRLASGANQAVRWEYVEGLIHTMRLCGGEVAMGWSEDEDDRRYLVVVNHEEQQSVWLADRELPAGW